MMRVRISLNSLLPLAALIGLVACAKGLAGPDLGGIYNRAAQQSDFERNPIIVIPGILGSRLVQEAEGLTVWGAFGGTWADPRKASGASGLRFGRSRQRTGQDNSQRPKCSTWRSRPA